MVHFVRSIGSNLHINDAHPEEGKKLTGAGKDSECKLYKMRWVILGIFMVYAVAAGMQWMQYSIICNIVVKYYHVERYVVEWTTMLHMLAYVLCILPALWMLEKAGNRITMLTAGAGICIGAWIKLFAVQPNLFPVVLVGQAIEAAAQVLTFGLAGSVTAAWFGPNEIALAGSMALFGDQFGVAFGFIFPPLLVHDSANEEEIGQGLNNLCLFIAIFTSVILITMLIFFKDTPDKPPSNAQIVQKECKKDSSSALDDFLKMLSSKSFILMLLSYGIHIGIFCSHATLLNQVFLEYFPEDVKHAGIIGSLMVFFGLVGAIAGGLYLDWKHLFKATTLFLYVCSTICLILYAFALTSKNLYLVYGIACFLGIFMLGYYSVGLQMAIEIVYPHSEGTAAGLMLLAVQILSLFLTPALRTIMERYGALVGNYTLIVLMFIGLIITIKIPPRTRRQDAETTMKKGETAKSYKINIES
ncbi:heme transporter FLVCR2-like [Planococcus citri]|uniref:heme transporter FLVCR2-like n=1 Tax=Planococcus citri TaxID=170843 RepID=UPI0031F72C72